MSPLNAHLTSDPSVVGSKNESPRALRSDSATSRAPDKPRSASLVRVWNCLVLSADPTRRRPLCEAAGLAGWNAVPCASVGDAIKQVERWRTQLAVIDLGAMPEVHKETYRRFSQRIAGRNEPLLLVCEDESAPKTELWARQVGVWIYLPSPELGEDLVDLFSEALRVADKLSGAGQSAPAR